MLTVQRLEIFNINTNDPMQQLFDSKFPAVFHCQKVTDHSPCLPHFLLLNAESKSSSRTDEIRHYDCHVKFENNTSGRARLWDTTLKFLCPGLSITSPDHLVKNSFMQTLLCNQNTSLKKEYKQVHALTHQKTYSSERSRVTNVMIPRRQGGINSFKWNREMSFFPVSFSLFVSIQLHSHCYAFKPTYWKYANRTHSLERG